MIKCSKSQLRDTEANYMHKENANLWLKAFPKRNLKMSFGGVKISEVWRVCFAGTGKEAGQDWPRL